jgi:hypothetical protein
MTMTKKIYRGEPGGIVKVILPSGRSRSLRHVVLHSPTGFGWGYGGSGPADLALSLLCDVLGERPSEKQLYHGRFKAQPYYQAFKREFVTGWEFGSRFEIDSETILAWLRKQGAAV